MYEGGTCTPLVVHWPKGVAAPSGTVTHQVGHVIDVMGTCVDVAGAKMPLRYHRITERLSASWHLDALNPILLLVGVIVLYGLGIGFVPFSPLGRGILTGAVSHDAEGDEDGRANREDADRG